MSAAAPRSAAPSDLRRTLRFIALKRAAVRFLPDDRARELAATLAGYDADLFSLDAVTESIARRRVHFGLLLSDEGAQALALALVAAWTSVPSK